MSRHKGQRSDSLLKQQTPLLVVTAVLLSLGWIGLVGSVHPHEMMVGVAVVVLSSAFCARLYRSATLPFKLRLRDVVQCWRIPWYILARCAEIVWLMLKDFAGQPVESVYRVCGFRTGMRDPVAVERTALAIAFITTAPNFIVIGIDAHQNHMLFHQLRRSSISKMAQALGAQP